LAFVRDNLPDSALHMEELLARAKAADENLARVRQGAKHAGDADPYRVSGAEEEAPGGPTGTTETPDAEDTGDRD
jgi:ribosome-binding factor A